MCSSSFSLTSRQLFLDMKRGCASPVLELFEFSEKTEPYLDNLKLAFTKTVCFFWEKLEENCQNFESKLTHMSLVNKNYTSRLLNNKNIL